MADSEDSAPAEDNGVLVLNTKNFDNIIFGKDIVLVEFYAPWYADSCFSFMNIMEFIYIIQIFELFKRY